MSAPRCLGLSCDALDRILPMHVWLDADGRVLSAGSTILKLIPDLRDGLSGRLTVAHAADEDVLGVLREGMQGGARLFLRPAAHPDLVLRGHAVRAGDDTILLNLGFGIALHNAIRSAGLIDADFAPTDLAIEFLFLHEANRYVLAELARFNAELSTARRIALSQAHSDPLTGLANRRGLDLALTGLLRRAREAASLARPFALVHLDLDHFKAVNDTLGHPAGDALLREIGEVLRLSIRRHDVAARLGGDEFVVLLRGLHLMEEVTTLADRIIASIREVNPLPATGLEISASLGVVIWRPGCDCDSEGLLALADEALYRSKRAGRDRATILEAAQPAGIG